MKISDVLRTKAPGVVTVNASTTVRTVVEQLAANDIGSLVVTEPDGRIAGIVSERDVVRRLPQQHSELLDLRAADIMTTFVTTCAPEDDVQMIMRIMTDKRIRHLPVVDASGLIGIVSIGDVVKSRIDDLETTANHLSHYISGG